MQGRRKSGFLPQPCCSLTNKLYGVTPLFCVFHFIYQNSIFSFPKILVDETLVSAMVFVFLRGKAVREDRLWYYPEQGGNNAMNTLPEPSYDVLLFGFQARERADKNYQVCGSHGTGLFTIWLTDLFHPYGSSCGTPLALCRVQRRVRSGLMRVPPSRTEL